MFSRSIIFMEPADMGRGTAQLVERPTEKPGTSHTNTGLSRRGGNKFYSQRQVPVQTLFRCPYSPLVHASASVSTLNIPNTGSHIPSLGHENTTQTDKNE